MTVPPEHGRRTGSAGHSTEPETDTPLDFDPYRFGAPEQPVPVEFAPPGYRQPASPAEPPRQFTPPTYSPDYPLPRTGNGKAIASMVLGIVSILLCWLTIFDAVPVVLAVVFGIVTLNEARRDPSRGGRGMAITGIICAAVGAVLAIAFTTWVLHVANQCGGVDTGNSSQLQQCVRDHV